MILAETGYFVLSPRWPTIGIVVAAAIATAGWAWLFAVSARLRRRRLPLGDLRRTLLAAGRLLTGFVAVWLVFQLLSRVFVLATSWRLWPMALLTVFLVEAMVHLYRLERRAVSRRMGLTLTGLRLVLLALIVLMLIQPVLATMWSVSRKRTVAVLLDVSPSMGIADPDLPAWRKLRLAEGFGLPAARRPYHLEQRAEALDRLRGEIAAEVGFLDALAKGAAASVQPQLLQHRKALHEKLAGWSERLDEQIVPIDAALAEVVDLPKDRKASLLDAKATLANTVRSRLAEAVGWTEKDKDVVAKLPERFDRLREGLRSAVGGLAKAAPPVNRAGEALDELLYGQLGEDDRRLADAIARLPRSLLAQSVLLHAPEGDEDAESLLARLSEDYEVKLYTFADRAQEADANRWTDAVGGIVSASIAPAGRPGLDSTSKPGDDHPVPAATQVAAPASAPADKDDDGPFQLTNFTAALAKVLSDVRPGDLAGVVALTDGQSNAGADPGPLARQLGGQGAALVAVAMGGETPPTDAGLIAIEAPETVYAGDKMYVNATVKLDGLSGRTAEVVLYDGDRKVDSRDVKAVGEVYRTRVQLGDEPKKAGLHAYRVEVSVKGDPPTEAFADNNAYPLTLSVTDDKAKVLLVESRPRWEYRYLKNLFSGRDQTVRIQYVLTEPDSFHGQPVPKTPTHVAATRKEGQEEADALWASEEELMKFDLVILGDVGGEDFQPRPLDPKAKPDPKAPEIARKRMAELAKFVTDRGGTLIVIAGPHAMPEKVIGTPLAELLPFRLTDKTTDMVKQAFQPVSAPLPAADKEPLPKKGFHFALTSEGAEHVICRQDVDPDKSGELWRALPEIYWRSRYTRAAPGAIVLAYALDPEAPKWLTGQWDGPATNPESIARKRRAWQNDHALIAVRSVGLGKVMMLSTDRTWRMRYRLGDTRHHKFWGQVLRWATAGKLPVGTALVKLGTDKTRYAPDDQPIVRAKLVRKDFAPVVTDQVAVKVFRKGSDSPLLRAPMRYVTDSPGLYTVTLDALPTGTYKLELESPEAAALLSEDGGQMKDIATEISVDPSAPAEQIELAANRAGLSRLAGLSHNGAVLAPERAGRLLEHLPESRITEKHTEEFALWDSWLLLALFCAAVTAEWILRKRAGLA